MAQRRTGTARDWMMTEDWPQGPLNEDAHPLTGRYSPGEMIVTGGGLFTLDTPVPHQKGAVGYGTYGAPQYGGSPDLSPEPVVGSDAWWRMMENSNMPRELVYRMLTQGGMPWATVPPRPSQMSFAPQRRMGG